MCPQRTLPLFHQLVHLLSGHGLGQTLSDWWARDAKYWLCRTARPQAPAIRGVVRCLGNRSDGKNGRSQQRGGGGERAREVSFKRGVSSHVGIFIPIDGILFDPGRALQLNFVDPGDTFVFRHGEPHRPVHRVFDADADGDQHLGFLAAVVAQLERRCGIRQNRGPL